MLTAATIVLPPEIRDRLRERAAFAQSFGDFVVDRLLGFGQPVAAAAALLGPLTISFAYLAADFFSMIEAATVFGSATVLILGAAYISNRQRIRDDYLRRAEARRQARDDLRAGAGTQVSLRLGRPPICLEHSGGVVVFADAGRGKTVFLDIPSDQDDPRWFRYLNGDLGRLEWSWLRLGGSGAVTAFETAGPLVSALGPPMTLDLPAGWDAISLALGDPRDGDVIDMPRDEIERTMERLL